jgi:hypothetical protein
LFLHNNIFSFIRLRSEGWAGEAWKPSNKTVLFIAPETEAVSHLLMIVSMHLLVSSFQTVSGTHTHRAKDAVEMDRRAPEKNEETYRTDRLLGTQGLPKQKPACCRGFLDNLTFINW